MLLDDQDRWDIARRLLRDDSLKSEDRLAGLLVLLYAQHTTVISRMTIDQIQAGGDTVRLSLGRVPVQLPEPAATLARTVAANRLTQRLEALGIRSRRTRSAALFQLATEIPAAILARTLGISTDVAVTWQRLPAGYAADISRRPPRSQPVSSRHETPPPP